MSRQILREDGPDPKTNRLLAQLAPADYDAMMLGAKLVSLKLRKRLHRQDERIDAVYFPLTCMVSLLVSTNDRPQMEMATVGREGVVGASELIQNQGAMGLNLIQIPGVAVRIDADAFRKLMSSRPLAQKVIHKHLYALMRQILYGAACNRLHSMEERCARRRATVNVATGMLKKAGFIGYVRGNLTVIDRRGLESASCDCYQAIIAAYESVLSDRSVRSVGLS
jgi:CRP-like cAMP-binding protein